jgi:hypothetical protein
MTTQSIVQPVSGTGRQADTSIGLSAVSDPEFTYP